MPLQPVAEPVVTVVMIFLNGENYIREAIESVINQTFHSWELMLVDDGSTDSSTQIAQSYASRFPGRIVYLEHESHCNRGTNASQCWHSGWAGTICGLPGFGRRLAALQTGAAGRLNGDVPGSRDDLRGQPLLA